MIRVRTFLAALGTALLLVVPTAAQAQTGNVAGRVFDGSNMRPLEGVIVEVGERSSLTNAEGRFLVTNVPVGTVTVRASIIGYATSETVVTVTAGQTSVLDFQLTLEALSLQGIVVTGYGQQEARDLTGVIEALSADEFNQGAITTPEELLQGKVAGVQVATPGFRGGVNIRIRGGTSVNASNEPLFVIDGVPLAVGGGLSAGSNPLAFLNPDDIESITVLKDASAAAIYGSRGANGVIMIETRGGRAGSQMSYSGSMTASSVIKDLEMVSAADFRTAVQTYAPQNSALLGSANTDWRDVITRVGYGQEHALDISGGTDQSNYRIGLGYAKRDGVVLGSDTERLSASLNFNQLLLNDRLSFEANIKGSRILDGFEGGAIGNATGFAPTQPVRNADNSYYEWNASAGLSPENPLAELDAITNQGTLYRSLGGVTAEFDLPWVTGLTATSNVGYDITKTENVYFAPSFLKAQAGGTNPGTVSRSNNTSLGVLFDAYLNYLRPVGENSDVEVTGGYSYENERSEYPSFYANGLATDFLGTSGLPAANELGADLNVQESRLISFFGRVNLNLDGKYLFTGSLRRDGSSRFGPDEQWGIFPSAAVAWRIIDEDFFPDDGLFSDLKFRFSWGVTGNQAFANYQQYSSYLISDQFARVQFGDRFVPTIRPSAADPGIKWEETTSWNLGVDFGLGNRFTGAVEYYKKDTDDLIFTVPVAGGTNLSDFVTTNIGSLTNHGLEFSLNGDIIEAMDEGDFSWNGSLTFAWNKNELTSVNAIGSGDEQILTGGIAGGVGNTIQVLQPGYPINSFYTYRHIRDSNGKPIWEDMNGDGSINAQDLYVDLNDDGVINEDDRSPNESPAPKYIIGHSSYFSMGQFDLSLALRAYLGNYVYNNVASDAGHFGRLTGTVPYSLHASALENGFTGPQYFSDIYVEDASFLRLDNITLGYNVEHRGLLNGARLFATVQNVLTLTGYSGIDPESLLRGIDNNLYPRARTISLGVSLGF